MQELDQFKDIIAVPFDGISLERFRRVSKSPAVKAYDTMIFLKFLYIFLIEFRRAHMTRDKNNRIVPTSVSSK